MGLFIFSLELKKRVLLLFFHCLLSLPPLLQILMESIRSPKSCPSAYEASVLFLLGWSVRVSPRLLPLAVSVGSTVSWRTCLLPYFGEGGSHPIGLLRKDRWELIFLPSTELKMTLFYSNSE